MTGRSKFSLALVALMAMTAPAFAEDLGSQIGGAFNSAYKGLKEGIFDAYEGGTEGAKDAWSTTKTEANKVLGSNNSSTAPSTASPYPAVRDDLTVNVQTELNAAGYSPGPADGIYGPRTSDAIRAYQGNNALPQDGQVSIALLDHMRAKRAGQPAVAPTAAYTAPRPAVQPAPITPQPPTVGTQSGTVPALPGQAAGQQAAGAPTCKPYQTKLIVDGKEQITQGTTCLQADGTWKPMN